MCIAGLGLLIGILARSEEQAVIFSLIPIFGSILSAIPAVAIGLRNGKAIATKILRTLGPAKNIRLTVDRSTIHADRSDLAYVTVEITDVAGNVLPDASNLVRFTLSGPGELAAVGSGAPNVPESFRQPKHTTWHGRALAILRPLGNSGKITLKAEADGLKAATIVVRTR